MLDSIRKNAADSLVLKVLFGIIALVFIFFYVGTGGFSQLEVVAQVNDTIVTKRDFDRTYANLANFYRNAAPNNPPSATQLGQQAFDQMVNSELLVQEAASLGLEVDAQELRDSIASLPDFQIDGRFNKSRYLEALQLNGLKPSDFESQQERQLLAGKVLEIIQAGVHVTETEIEDHFRFENDSVKIRFIKVPRSEFIDSVSFTEPDLDDFYGENKEQFREPERTSIRYMAFRPEAFENQIVPSDEDLQIQYDSQRSKYDIGEQVRARHILLKMSPDATDEEKEARRKEAIDIRKRAVEGEDFGDLAKEFSEDSTASAGGDLGFFARGVMTGAFEEASFALEPGAISDLVETQFGLHIIKLEEKIPARTKSLDEVRDEVRQTIQKRESRKFTLQRVEEAFEKVLDGATFAEIASEYSVSVEESSAFARNEAIAGLGRQPKIAEAAFAVDKNEVGEIMNLDNGYMIFEVTDRIPSSVPPLADIRDAVTAKLREARAGEAAMARAQELLTALQSAPDIDVLAESEGVEVEESGEVGRFGGYIPNLGNAPDLKTAAFNLSDTNPVAPKAYSVGGDAVVAVLGERVPAKPEELESNKDRLTERLRAQREATVVAEFIQGLRDRSTIQIGQGYTFTTEDS